VLAGGGPSYGASMSADDAGREPNAVPEVTGDSVLQSQTLEEISEAKNYHAWLTSLALPHLGDHPIEVGSGLGDYAQTWLDAGVPRITVTEPDAVRAARLAERFAHDDRVLARRIGLPTAETGEHSALVAFNVLEHVPDHVAALRSAGGLVRPGGPVVILVPAFPSVMSDFDRRIGHVRRYRRRSLVEAYEQAGLTVDDVHHVNAIGLPAWWLMMKVLHGTPSNSPLLRFYDRTVVPVMRSAERVRRAPFGQSLIAIGHAPG
jgi:SAM-dependent methyltransferase